MELGYRIAAIVLVVMMFVGEARAGGAVRIADALIGSESPRSQATVAVYGHADSEQQDLYLQKFMAALRNSLVDSGRFSVLSKDRTHAILGKFTPSNEQQNVAQKPISPATDADLGRMLGVRYVIITRINILRDTEEHRNMLSYLSMTMMQKSMMPNSYVNKLELDGRIEVVDVRSGNVVQSLEDRRSAISRPSQNPMPLSAEEEDKVLAAAADSIVSKIDNTKLSVNNVDQEGSPIPSDFSFGRYWKLNDSGLNCVSTPESMQENSLRHTAENLSNAAYFGPQDQRSVALEQYNVLEQYIGDEPIEKYNCALQAQKNNQASLATAELQNKKREEEIEQSNAHDEEQRRHALEQENRDKARRDAKQVADNIAALPERRREVAHRIDRCVNKLSLIDCVTARVDALENYQTDRQLKNNSMLCLDRGQAATAIAYQAQLNSGNFTSQIEVALLDGLLGEMIDNCPDRAQAALKMRHAIHNL